MCKADSGVELGITSHSFFDAWHTDKYHSDLEVIKDVSEFFEGIKFEPVCFINNNESEIG